MCGITGWISYDTDLEARRSVLAKMTETMARRGPDAGGVWIHRHAGLGHRRLAVMDPQGGAQPMKATEQGRTIAVLVYNGEIYNFAQLREELQHRGHEFRTHCDTEVLLRGYLQWGEDVIERLNGMFAFAVWDLRTEELLLVRDRLGVKPLFYYPTADGVVFGSEPKAILAHPDIQPRMDRAGLREALQLVKTPEQTLYKGMSEVRPGQTVRVRHKGLVKRLYWSLTAHEHEHDLPRTIDTVAGLLDDIVKRQIVSDVPLCTLLSGGLDSSAITALAHRQTLQCHGRSVRTFSIDFAHHDEHFVPNPIQVSQDGPFVREFVQHAGCDHQQVTLESSTLADRDLSRQVIRALDGPINLPADTFSSLYRLFEAVRSQSTVALSGESADELFGGYAWFHHPMAVNAPTFTWLAAAGDVFCPTDVLDPEMTERLRLPAFVADSYDQAIRETPKCRSDSPAERRMREISYLHLTRFLPALLDRKDRMSMALGLEVRVPFCDHRLVEYVFNIPWQLKSFDGREKSILRAAARELLPASIADRRKVPYPSTHDPAYERAVRSQVTEMLEDSSHPATFLFDRGVVENMLDQPLSNSSSVTGRAGLERVRSLGTWIEDYRVALEI
jgi:asparagine synthase (glutamine-hydrolysing)